jgi:hypothetical protein
MPGLKISFTYYNTFLHLLLVSIAFAVIWIGRTRADDLSNRLMFLLVINTLVLLVPAISIYKYLQTDKKIWGSKIKWTDFKGEVPRDTENFAAQISTHFLLKYNKAFNVPRIASVTVMSKSNSWASAIYAKYNSNNLLNHEQIHFDISEWTRREFQDSIGTLDKISEHTVQDIYAYFLELNNKRQDEYDSASNHGSDVTNQIKWNEKIHQKLK